MKKFLIFLFGLMTGGFLVLAYDKWNSNHPYYLRRRPITYYRPYRTYTDWRDEREDEDEDQD